MNRDSVCGVVSHVELGIERLLHDKSDLLRRQRIGLVCNQASVDKDFRHAADLLNAHASINLTALFGPQHGIRGDVQDNMIETPHGFDAQTKLPVHSLYSETREPTEQMLKDVDTLVIDLQDVGCRIYTFIYTMANCMRAAARYGKKIVVCDRPNPIGGEAVEGWCLEKGWESFVGQFPLPTRHGMTIGELAKLFYHEYGLACDLEVVQMLGWTRDKYFDETDAAWVMPSPNMPTVETATVFPGTVYFEGTQISEGRGTTKPFELIGAPFIDAQELQARMLEYDLAGVKFRACGFQPTFQKHAGKTCGGVQLHVTERRAFKPYAVGIALLKEIYDLAAGEDFKWKDTPYEYVYDKNPFDVIAGTDKLRKLIKAGETLETINKFSEESAVAFKTQRNKYLLY